MNWDCRQAPAIPMDKRQQDRRSIFCSLKDAFRGIWCSVKSERNIRFHFIVMAYVLFVAFSIKLSRAEIAVLFLTIGSVLSAEMLNTAVEKHCDFNQKKHCGPIRNVKDIAAGAVLIAAVIAVLVGVIIFWRDSFWAFLFSVLMNPLQFVLLLLSFVVAYFFISWGPVKIAQKWLNKE